MEPTLDIKIVDLANSGEAVGKTSDGKTVFVHGAMPGESVRAGNLEHKKSWARGQLVEILQPALDRIKPACRHFATCGGCSWQHIPYSKQLQAKQDIATRALRHVYKQIDKVVAAEEPLHWRRRARWHFDGMRLGYFGRRSNEVIHISECPQLMPALETVGVLLAAGASSWLKQPCEVHALANDQGQVGLFVESELSPDAMSQLLDIEGVAGVMTNSDSVGVTLFRVAPRVMVTPAEFAQASISGNRELRSIVSERAANWAGHAVLELYAGAGNFTEILMRAGAKVTAVDWEKPEAPLDVDFYHGDVEDYLKRKPQLPVHAVLLDPPRSGALATCRALANRDLKEIVYISCDAATLARDVAALSESYVVKDITLVDTMPMTPHFELVVFLERKR